MTFRASKMVLEAAAAMAKPGMNETDMSQRPPTNIGDTNTAKPEKVRTRTCTGLSLPVFEFDSMPEHK